MAWGRGFFRLWVAMSALWVAFSVLMFWERLTAPSVPLLNFTIEPGGRDPVAYRMETDEYERLLARKNRGELKLIPIGNDNLAYVPTDLNLGERADHLIKIQDAAPSIRAKDAAKKFRGDIGEMLKMAAFVPVILLVLGNVVGWVVSGFRKPA